MSSDATIDFPPGPLIRLAQGDVEADLAPEAGGRIAQIRFRGREQLVGPGDGSQAMIAWGCYPMVPWAGRIRRGEFAFEDRQYRLPCNFGPHAIHGVGFALPWTVDDVSGNAMSLHLRLPTDERWPFGGVARQDIRLGDDGIRMALSVQAGERAMPAAIGWHPWFRKPDGMEASPRYVYPRDADGIATLPLSKPAPPPWDDCLIHPDPIVLHAGGHRLELRSDCGHWVIYDGLPHATCVEPQTGPPDAFNIAAEVLAPGQRLRMFLEMRWDQQ